MDVGVTIIQDFGYAGEMIFRFYREIYANTN